MTDALTARLAAELAKQTDWPFTFTAAAAVVTARDVAVAEIGQGVQPLRAVQRQDDHAGVRAVQAFLCEQRHGAVS